MATTRKATAQWQGSLIEGSGKVSLDSSGLGTYDVTWASRAEEPAGRTSPEEGIAGIRLKVRGTVPGLGADEFAKAADAAKATCPVSKALTGTTITLDAAL